MQRHVAEILISRQQCQIMPHAQLRQQRIDGPDLNATGSTQISQSSGGNVILAVRHDQRKGREAIDHLIAGFWSGESLQQLLQNQAGRHNMVASLDCTQERTNLGNVSWLIAPQRQRPDAGVNEQTQRRVRSIL